MPEISLNNINNFALKNFNLQIRDGEFIVVAGSNGAGKTTLINVIAGLVSYTGSVQFNGQSIDSMPPSKRNVGYVFQNLVLFPHMDAFSNIAFGLKAKKFNDDEIKTRTGEMLKFMEIEHLAFRHPSEMSGGEKQRVALARALAPKPDVLLLDEPTSNLDIKTARHLKNELKQIQRRTQITTIYVTHIMSDAMEMADRISILENGTLAQVDEPDNILFYPQDPAVLRILGTPNILTCDNCIDLGNGIMQVECNGLKLFVPHEGGTVRKISILPNHIYLSRNKPEGRGINGFQGTVVDIGASGGYSAITVDVMGQRIVAEIPSYAYREMNLKQGDPVFIILRMKKIQACENTCHHKTSCNFKQIKHLE